MDSRLRRTLGVTLLVVLFLAGPGTWPRPVLATGPCGDLVTVTFGDTLTEIADRCNTTVDAIVEANPAVQNPNLIYVGQRLAMPELTEPEVTRYTVQSGDTLTEIAARYGTTVEAIVGANPEITDPNMIDVGQELTIPTEQRAPRVTISPMSGPPGTTVGVAASGFPADTEVQVGAGVINTEFGVVHDARTDENGTLAVDLVMPQFAEPGERWVVVVRVVGTEIRATSDVFLVASPTEGETWQRVNMYLIALDDGGQAGPEIGCNDSVVPVEVVVQPTLAPLTAALEALLQAEGPDYGASGLYNSLYRSDLTLQDVTIVGGKATIRLAGEVQLGGVCDEPRFEAQLEYTALQFATVDEVEIWINGRPLSEVI